VPLLLIIALVAIFTGATIREIVLTVLLAMALFMPLNFARSLRQLRHLDAAATHEEQARGPGASAAG